MPFQVVSLVVAFVLEHYKMVTSKNEGVQQIRDFFAQREVIDVAISSDIVEKLEEFTSGIQYNGKIVNTAIATAMGLDGDELKYKEAVRHAYKGLHQMLENIWIPVVASTLSENKQTQYIEHKVHLDDMTSMQFEAYVTTFDCGFIILLGAGVVFNEEFAKQDHLIYYPTIMFHGKEGVSDEQTEIGRSRLDKIFKNMEHNDLPGILVAFENAMKVSTYS